MIAVCDKPAVFKAMHDNMFFIRGYDDKGDYAYLAVDFRVPESAFIHLEVTRWNHNTLKALLEDWQAIIRFFRNSEVRHVAVMRLGRREDLEKFIRFIARFGFMTVYEHISSTQEI